MMTRAYIVAAFRTSVVPHGGAFRDLDFDILAEAPIHQCLRHAGIETGNVDELILSNALGAGGNPARVCALRAGLPGKVAGLSIDRQCAGGLDAILLAQAMIQSGQAQVVLAGGSESYSLRPDRSYKKAWETDPVPKNQARFTPWPDQDPDMADAAEALAQQENILQAIQDEWAIESHAKALAAAEQLKSETCNPAGTAGTNVFVDPFSRNLTSELCRRATILNGSITAANACVSADGAAMVLVVSEQIFKKLNLSSALSILAGQTIGGDHQIPGLAPVNAIRKVLEAGKKSVDQLTTIELMEAYAVQAIACAGQANLPLDRINKGGGALARGHPVGASGAILAVRLFHELSRSGGKGLAAIAAAGGLGTAMLVEAVSR